MRGRAASGGRAPRRPCRPRHAELSSACGRRPRHDATGGHRRRTQPPSSLGRTPERIQAPRCPRHHRLVQDPGEAHLPRTRPHHLLRGPGQRTTRGLTPGAQAAVEGGAREARSTRQPAPGVGTLVDARNARREAVGGPLRLLRGGHRPPHPHRRHDGHTEGGRTHARESTRQRGTVHCVGIRPPRGCRGLLLHPPPLPRLRFHGELPGWPAPGRDHRHVPEVRHDARARRPAPPPLHVLPGRSPHVRTPSGSSRRHGRRPIFHPFLPVRRDASVGTASPEMGGSDRRSHDRGLWHDRGLSGPPRLTLGFLARTRGARSAFPLHTRAYRRSRESHPRRCRRRRRRAHCIGPSGLFRLLEPGRRNRRSLHLRRLAAYGRPSPGARRFHLHGGPPQGDDQFLRFQRLPLPGGGCRALHAGRG